MAAGEVDCVITGADRIAANGDTANKIGTYSLAVLARHHGIPFYVVAPSSTVDLAHADGADDPDRGARPGRGHGALRRAQPGVRRDAGGADHGDRHRARRAPRAVRRFAGGQRSPREGADSRGGVRDPPSPADRHVAKPLLPVGGRPMIDWILDRLAEVAEVDEVHVVTNARYAPAFDGGRADAT